MGTVSFLTKKLNKRKRKMASPICCLPMLVIPLLVTSLFYHVSNADQALLENVCKTTDDYNYCLSALRSNRQSTAATPYQLGIISNDVTLTVIQETGRAIGDLLLKLTDPVDIRRISHCQGNVKTAFQKWQIAKRAATQKSYTEEYNAIAEGIAQIVECKFQYDDPPKKGITNIKFDSQSRDANRYFLCYN